MMTSIRSQVKNHPCAVRLQLVFYGTILEALGNRTFSDNPEGLVERPAFLQLIKAAIAQVKSTQACKNCG
jgi:hypothetical protein